MASGAIDIVHLVFDELLDIGSGWGGVFADFVFLRLFDKEFSDRAGEDDAEVGAGIDLANATSGSFAKHIVWDADGGRHLSAELIQAGDGILRNRRSAVQNEREARKLGGYFIQDIQT